MTPTEWISVQDKPVPKKGKFLAIDKDGDQAVVWCDGNSLIRGGYYDSNGGGDDFFNDVTHWMPLPEAPKE